VPRTMGVYGTLDPYALAVMFRKGALLGHGADLPGKAQGKSPSICRMGLSIVNDASLTH
jgi:hypothetical protein